MPHFKNSFSLVRMGWLPVLDTIKFPLGRDFNSSGVISGLCIIWRAWLGSFFPRLMEPDITVLFPRLLDSASADSEFGAKPPKMVSWQLSMMISAPSFPSFLVSWVIYCIICTILTLREREAENIISALSIFGMVPTSSQ